MLLDDPGKTRRWHIKAFERRVGRVGFGVYWASWTLAKAEDSMILIDFDWFCLSCPISSDFRIFCLTPENQKISNNLVLSRFGIPLWDSWSTSAWPCEWNIPLPSCTLAAPACAGSSGKSLWVVGWGMEVAVKAGMNIIWSFLELWI